ncbi:MAG TPA: hypothetical protein VK804_27575 [Bradyrhizobium sp.]|uniref:hypothetical protein n=1 Tax=Bradyrhizobium sp. TaxID=376 RepID=UPI002CF993AB|nr:hypothetical protein [Bradyrhizobium sp.]HTB04245.1 hypothetical protein [Bradyrhizobium sp.]
MAKILIGVVAALVIAAGGFFGFQFYIQHRVAGEVEAAFEQIRATGAKASHGKVSFDLWKRTVTVADIASESAAQPPVSARIASVTASGVSQPDAARFSADSIEATDIEIGAAMAAPSGFKLTYKIPRITIKDYSGPAGMPRRPASSALIDIYRFGLEQFADVTASSVTVPSIAATINFGAVTPGGGDVAYTGLAMQGIKDGKIASMKIDGFVFTANMQQAGKVEKITGNLVNLASYDLDLSALAAILDPQKANDDRYYRAYRQITVGPYVITGAQGLNMRIDGMTIDDVGFKPSRMQIPALLAMLPQAGAAPPTPAQAREMIEKISSLYEGVHIANAEMRGLSVETPQGPFKLAAMRFNLEAGKIGEFAIEGLDAKAPKGPVKVGRFALKSFDIANLLRMSALFMNPAQKPPPEQLLGLLTLLQGVEVKGFVVPDKDSGKPISIDQLNLNWGQFVGPIPSQARLAGKMSAPIEASEASLRPLLDAGMDRLAIDLDLGAAWTEASRTFVVDPATLELGGLLKAQARVSLANVPRGVFSPNLPQAAAMAGQIEAGTLELVVQDLGGVDLAVAQYARTQNVSPDAARAAIAEKIRSSVDPTTASDPDAMAIVEAAARYVENPRGTLTLKLTPRGKLPVMPMIQALNTDPLVVLAQFQVEVATGR